MTQPIRQLGGNPRPPWDGPGFWRHQQDLAEAGRPIMPTHPLRAVSGPPGHADGQSRGNVWRRIRAALVVAWYIVMMAAAVVILAGAVRAHAAVNMPAPAVFTDVCRNSVVTSASTAHSLHRQYGYPIGHLSRQWWAVYLPC